MTRSRTASVNALIVSLMGCSSAPFQRMGKEGDRPHRGAQRARNHRRPWHRGTSARRPRSVQSQCRPCDLPVRPGRARRDHLDDRGGGPDAGRRHRLSDPRFRALHRQPAGSPSSATRRSRLTSRTAGRHQTSARACICIRSTARRIGSAPTRPPSDTETSASPRWSWESGTTQPTPTYSEEDRQNT